MKEESDEPPLRFHVRGWDCTGLWGIFAVTIRGRVPLIQKYDGGNTEKAHRLALEGSCNAAERKWPFPPVFSPPPLRGHLPFLLRHRNQSPSHQVHP